MATVLARMDGADTNGSVWYEKGMAWAAENGADAGDANAPATVQQILDMLAATGADVSGLADGMNPASPATRAGLAQIVYRSLTK